MRTDLKLLLASYVNALHRDYPYLTEDDLLTYAREYMNSIIM